MKKTTVVKTSATKTLAKKTTKKGEKNIVAKRSSKTNAINNDSKSINAVIIGKQVWMTRNLDVLKFRNGDDIKLAKNVSEWKKLNEKEIPACCYYDGDDAVKDNKTLLYNWFAVIDKRGLAPKGWIVPSLDDWNELVTFVGSDKKSLRKLKSKEIWDGSAYLVNNSFGTNKTGFNLMPTGERTFPSSEFHSAKLSAILWTSNPARTKSAYFVEFDFSNKYISSFGYKQLGLAVRCIKK